MNKVTGSLTTARLAGLKERIDNREARIGIVGMGYVGLPLALLFSGERFRVTGFDISPDKVATLNAGGSYIVRILPAAIQQARQASGPRPITLRSRRWTRSSSACPPRSMSITSPT